MCAMLAMTPLALMKAMLSGTWRVLHVESQFLVAREDEEHSLVGLQALAEHHSHFPLLGRAGGFDGQLPAAEFDLHLVEALRLRPAGARGRQEQADAPAGATDELSQVHRE